MRVFKFGGASVKDAEAIKNVAQVIRSNNGPLVVVVSAMGKTTNALEKVVYNYFNGKDNPTHLLNDIKFRHAEVINELFGESAPQVLSLVNDLFVEIDWIIEDDVHDPYDYLYDQIVSVGELVSSTILHHYLLFSDIQSNWLDVRSVLITDEQYRRATVNFALTERKMNKHLPRIFESSSVIVTQGFIGSTLENNSTTLGREGSDYTASVFSYCMNVDSMHIWKDVPGILTADPALFDNTTKIDRLTYREAIEMAYYGAKVIHPKTIKPIQNKSIPLYVRPFNTPEEEGTLISDDGLESYPPMIVVEPDQSILFISTKDFSFVAEHHLKQIFSLLALHNVKVNMMRNTAISFTLSTNTDKQKLEALVKDLEATFKVTLDHGLELVTIRHFDKATIKSLKEGKLVIYEESLRDTMQMVTKDVPQLIRK